MRFGSSAGDRPGAPRLTSSELDQTAAGNFFGIPGPQRCRQRRILHRLGKPSYVRPSSVLPVFFLCTPPHCLKKNGTCAASHCSRIDSTQSSFIGRAPGPLSPLAITQEMPSRGSAPRSSRSGSTDKKRTAAGVYDLRLRRPTRYVILSQRPAVVRKTPPAAARNPS
jgi:hypothetical protein